MPEDAEGWLGLLNARMEELGTEVVPQAYEGKATAVAIIVAWAAEMEAAALFLATYTGALQADAEMLVDVANTVIDTVQAILLALGIAHMLKKLKKKRRTYVLEVVVTERAARTNLGDRTSPVPSAKDADKVREASFLQLRSIWATHFMLTALQALLMQSGLKPGQELVWKAKKDKVTCPICREMDGKKSVGGNFLPVILKLFPDYKPYTGWMGWPHAHPRCRCVAIVG